MSELNNTPSSIDDGIPEVNFTLEVAETVQAPVDDTLSISGEAADAKATGDKIAEVKAELEEEIQDIAINVSGVANTLFPVGCIYPTTSATAPTFGDDWTWEEIKMPATWGDIEDGFRSYEPVASGDTTGTIHFWKRTA